MRHAIKQRRMQNIIMQPHLEAAGEKQQAEAWFKELSDESAGQQHGTRYRSLYLLWLQKPMPAHAAYLQRAIMNIRAKCYLQVYWLSCCLIQLLPGLL